MSTAWALTVMASGFHEPPDNFMPVLAVDDQSFACVICAPASAPEMPGTGLVVRWHLGEIHPDYQAELLDRDLVAYVQSVAEELSERDQGLRRIRRYADQYRGDYLDRGDRPKGYVVRPIQLACQNVIIGFAAFSHDSSFDGLSVPAWQTCEVPHVATHEGNRALAALMLCDAFQNGGTMEIRFDQHPERAVPASLRRYARSQGFELGVDDPAAISPREARELFLAVTPMPSGLADRARAAADSGVISPERLCFTLLVPVWREIELDFLLACSPRAASLLTGGTTTEFRPERSGEFEVARAALMAGMLYRRLDSSDTAGEGGEARVFEDTRHGVRWEILDEHGAVRFTDVPAGPLPWQRFGLEVAELDGGTFVVVPRAHPANADVAVAHSLADGAAEPVVFVVPADRVDLIDCDFPVLSCPDRLSELDAAIEQKLMTARLTRS